MITFTDLSTEAVRIDLEEPTYRHEDQMSSKMSDAGKIFMWTPNGTRTYDVQGNPHDNDQD